MKIGSRKLSSFLPRPLRPAATRLGLERKRMRFGLRQVLLRARNRVGRGIRHVHGPRSMRLEPGELVVTCLVRNGMPWLEAFLDHYRRLGVRHMVFLDNESTDETQSIVRDQHDTSLFVTGLPFAPYIVPLKRWLLQDFAQGGWMLYCDIDEFFEFPRSERIDLSEFLAYLDASEFDAVAAQMLDMYSTEPLQEIQGRDDADLKDVYRFYDLADIVRREDEYWIRMNDLGTAPIVEHGGGIRSGAFGWEGSMLTKHPLVRSSSAVRIFPYDDHFVTGARLADVTTVLRHYKFTGAFLEQAREYTRSDRQFNNAGIYRRYREVVGSEDRFRLVTPTTQEWTSTDALVEQGFLTESEAYRRWVADRTSSRPRAAEPSPPG